MSTPAAAAVLAALPLRERQIEVVGDGALAEELRETLGADLASGDGRAPSAVVDTTGDPRQIRDALGRVEDLGTVVLAGPAPAEHMALDLYRDVHLRGLTVVGVGADAAPAASGPPSAG